MGRRRYNPEVKAAVMAQLMQGQKPAFLSEEYDIPEGTIKSWGHRNPVATQATPKQQHEIADLLMEFLRQGLITVTTQMEFFRNEQWLKKQTASDSAVLFGVELDKIIRLLGALAPYETESSTGTE